MSSSVSIISSSSSFLSSSSSSSSSVSSSSSSSSISVSSSEITLKPIGPADVCGICQEKFLDTSAKTHLVFHINCHNYFHKDCIISALKIDRRCPNCRQETDDLNTRQVELGADRQIALIAGEKLPLVDERAQVAYRRWAHAPFEGQISNVEQTLVQASAPASSEEIRTRLYLAALISHRHPSLGFSSFF